MYICIYIYKYIYISTVHSSYRSVFDGSCSVGGPSFKTYQDRSSNSYSVTEVASKSALDFVCGLESYFFYALESCFSVPFFINHHKLTFINVY